MPISRINANSACTMQMFVAIVATSKRNNAKRTGEFKMKKSEIIANAIAKIESLRPDVAPFIDAYLASGLTCGFVASEFNAAYEAENDDWFSNHKAISVHLNVALSVAIADEYLEVNVG